MDTTLLKSFATSSRTELIREVAARITAVLAPGSPERVEQPRAVSELERAISVGGGGDKGKAHVADRVAYTWFNRIIALRFMDANGYTGIGVVSPAADQVGQPEILSAAKRGQVDGDVVKGANVATVTGLLNGTRQPRPGVDAQAEAYSLLLADYCRYWNRAMPFMFEREGDFTELLIPANVLAEDSVLSRSVTVLTEEVCQDVEVIGWLYQFYISERKDEVFAGFKKNKKAGADEIPAATQLFTPHWIVRYLVENSVGRLWMLNHPESRLVDQMDYYIAPVDEETDFLKITKPEELTVIDPACGSGHMLTYAFDLLYAIYEEEGYTPSQIPGLILTNNLYGTEIDPRAGALAAFALTMKATARRKLFLRDPVEPNICVLEPISFTADELTDLVTEDGDRHAEEAFWNQFAEADTIGALIQPDSALVDWLSKYLDTHGHDGELFRADAFDRADRALRQAQFLVSGYSVVVTNPPYLGRRNMNEKLSAFARASFPRSKSDLYAMFIERARLLTNQLGYVALVAQQSWMFLSSFRVLRENILKSGSIVSLVHLGAGAFDAITGEVVSTAAFVIEGKSHAKGAFIRLTELPGAEAKRLGMAKAVRNIETQYQASSRDFLTVPGAPIAYWLSKEARESFGLPEIASLGRPRVGMQTADNDRFLRYWWEVSHSSIGIPGDAQPVWVRYLKGGSSRRWAGTLEYVVHFDGDGSAIRKTPNGSVISLERAELPKLEWTDISTSGFALRSARPLAMHDIKSHCFYPAEEDRTWILAYANSSIFRAYLSFLSPGLSNQVGDVGRVPLLPFDRSLLGALGREAESVAIEDWEEREVCLDFPGLVGMESAVSLRVWSSNRVSAREERNEHLTALDAEVDKEIRRVAPFGLELNAHEPSYVYECMSPRDSILDLMSYAVGCMFGRYSLDAPGLILADQGATLHDYLAEVPNPVFTPDSDNVIPIVDGDWFEDDIVERFRQFLRAAFGEQHFEENLQFVTESLGVKHLRDYFVKSFYKDHVKCYKKRPIYWLFSSPKGSFNALIYMHRYTPSTVSTVLTYLREYVTKLESALQQAERAGNAKEADRLRKILVELNEYEHDTLFPKASENIVIDLDDGVKVNYPKFGAALKKVPGLEAASD